MRRIAAWRDTFILINGNAFEKLDGMIKDSMRNITKSRRSHNGKQALEESWHKWLLSGGNAFVTQAGGNLLEDDRVDGVAGMLHLGLTLLGHRDLRC